MRNHGIDWVRGIAAFFIVGCHVGLFPRTEMGMAITHFCDLNVGVFGAISGFLMAKRFECKWRGWREYAVSRISRLLGLYLFWTLFYLLASFVFSLLAGAGVKEKYSTVDFWFSALVNGGSSCHLWFVVWLLYIQVAVAALRVIVSDRCLFYGMLGALSVIALMLCTGTGFYRTYPCRLLSFVLLGAFVYQLSHTLRRCLSGWRAACLLFVFVCVHCLWSDVHAFYRDYLLAAVIVMVASCSKGSFDSRQGVLSRILRALSDNSMGVYLLHPFFAAGVAVFFRKLLDTPYSSWAIAMAWILDYALAYFATLLINRMPWGVKVIK